MSLPARAVSLPVLEARVAGQGSSSGANAPEHGRQEYLHSCRLVARLFPDRSLVAKCLYPFWLKCFNDFCRKSQPGDAGKKLWYGAVSFIFGLSYIPEDAVFHRRGSGSAAVVVVTIPTRLICEVVRSISPGVILSGQLSSAPSHAPSTGSAHTLSSTSSG